MVEKCQNEMKSQRKDMVMARAGNRLSAPANRYYIFSLNTAVLRKTAVFFYSTKYRITLLKITIYEKTIDQLSAVAENRLRFLFVAKSRYMTFYRQRAPPPYQLFDFKK